MKRNQPQGNTQVHMHGWDDACKAVLSHKCDVTRLCINEQRSVCSVLSVVHVHVRDSVYVVHRVWLKVDVVVAIICNLTKSFVRDFNSSTPPVFLRVVLFCILSALSSHLSHLFHLLQSRFSRRACVVS